MRRGVKRGSRRFFWSLRGPATQEATTRPNANSRLPQPVRLFTHVRVLCRSKAPRAMAATVKAHIKPALITWARETAGFATADAAARLGIEEARLIDWENPASDAAPSIPQLRKLAALFKRPLAVFYLQEAPRRFETMRDLRRLPGTGVRHYSPALQLEIRAANERRELALELAADLEQEIPNFTLSATDKEDTEKVGKRNQATVRLSAARFPL